MDTWSTWLLSLCKSKRCKVSKLYILDCFFRLAPSDKLEDAYHVYMVVSGIILGALSFLSFISVDLI
jgi:hypothetical protein